MASYRITIMGITAANIKQLEKKVKEAFGEEFAAQVTKQDPARSRADRLAEADSDVENAKGVVQELKDELEEWQSNLPENLQSGSKNDELQEAIDGLEEISSNLENVDFSSVSFPSMM